MRYKNRNINYQDKDTHYQDHNSLFQGINDIAYRTFSSLTHVEVRR